MTGIGGCQDGRGCRMDYTHSPLIIGVHREENVKGYTPTCGVLMSVFMRVQMRVLGQKIPNIFGLNKVQIYFCLT